MNWDYIQPVSIRFGKGRRKEIAEIAKEINGSNGILVATPFFLKSGLAKEMMEESQGKLSTLFSEVSVNPEVSEVDACADLIREKKIDFVVALGGGSAMDLAKAASVIACTKDSITEYHGTNKKLPLQHLPLIALPTTAGTGSEVTCVSVLSDSKQGKKMPIVSDAFYPHTAIIDPELTYSMPAHVTAATGIDVLAHALEGYWSKGHQPICDACAYHALDLVFQYLERAYTNPTDEEAREKMCEASLIAGLAFTLPKTTSSHACSFPLTNLYHIPHGEACGLTLDYFARINANGKEGKRIDLLAQKLGFKDTDDLADHIYDLKTKLHLRKDLKDLSLNEEQIEELVHLSRHPNLLNNPVDITDEMLRDMYQQMA